MEVHESVIQCEWPCRPLVKILSAFQGADPDEGDATEKFLRSEAQSVLDYLHLAQIYKLGAVSLSQIDRRAANGRLFKAKTPCVALVPKGHSGCFLYRWGCVAESCIALPEEAHAIAFMQTRSELWAKKPTEIVTIALEATQLYRMEQFTACAGCAVWKGLPVTEVIDPTPDQPSQFLVEPLDAQAIAEAKLLSILDARRGNKLFEERIALNATVPNTSAFRYLVLDVPPGRKCRTLVKHAEYVNHQHECELDRGDIVIFDDTSGVWTVTVTGMTQGGTATGTAGGGTATDTATGGWILYHPEGVGLENPELSRRSMIGTGMSESRCIPYAVPKTAFKPDASLTLLKHHVKTALLEHKRTAPWMRSAELQTPSEITETRIATIKTAQFDPTVFAFIAGEGSAVISEEGNGTRLVPIRNLVGSIWWLWPQTTAHLTSSNGAALRFIVFPGRFKPLRVMPEKLPEPWAVTVCRRVASPLHLANVPDCAELEAEGDAQVSLMPALVCMLEGAPVDPAAFAWRVAVDESGPIANDRVILIPLRLTDKEPGEEPPQGWSSLDVEFAPPEAKVGGHAVRVGDIVFTEGRHVYLLAGTWLVGECAEEAIAPAAPGDCAAVGESAEVVGDSAEAIGYSAEVVDVRDRETADQVAEEVAGSAVPLVHPTSYEALPEAETPPLDVVEEEPPGDDEDQIPVDPPLPVEDLTSPRKKRRLLTDDAAAGATAGGGGGGGTA